MGAIGAVVAEHDAMRAAVAIDRGAYHPQLTVVVAEPFNLVAQRVQRLQRACDGRR